MNLAILDLALAIAAVVAAAWFVVGRFTARPRSSSPLVQIARRQK